MTELQFELEPRGAKAWSLSDLMQLEEKKLQEDRVVERAGASSLYRNQWRGVGLQPSEVRTLADLRRVPFTTDQDIVRAEAGRFGARLACSKVRLWFSTAGVHGARKWIPYSDRDIRQIMGLWARVGRVVGAREGDVVLAVTDPAPRISNGFPYLWAMMDRLETGLNLEFIVGSMFMAERNNWPEFALRKQPDVLLARPSDALALVDHLATAADQPDARPRDLLRKLRTVIFFGEPLAPKRRAVVDAYGVEPFDCYASAEVCSLSVDCAAHGGLHLWMDICIPEVIPLKELDAEKADPSYQPRSVFLGEAEDGLSGEFVATTFSEALPLIRYRTGDLVEVVSKRPCSCGITHPRVLFLGRVEADTATEGVPAPRNRGGLAT